MARGTIGFACDLVNRNLTGFSRQVAFVQAIGQCESLVRIGSEIRCFRVHFAGKESLGIDHIDLYFTDWEWQQLLLDSQSIIDLTIHGPT